MADDFIFTSGSLTSATRQALRQDLRRRGRPVPGRRPAAEGQRGMRRGDRHSVPGAALRQFGPSTSAVAREAIRAAGYTQGGFRRSCSIMTLLAEGAGNSMSASWTWPTTTAASRASGHAVRLRLRPDPGYLPCRSPWPTPCGASTLRGDGRCWAMPTAAVSAEYRERRPSRVRPSRWSPGSGWKATGWRRWRDLEEQVTAVLTEQVPELARDTQILVNPTAGCARRPEVHAGLTGRKTAIDTYGEYARHSGAALLRQRSGPDRPRRRFARGRPRARGGGRPGPRMRGAARLRHRPCRPSIPTSKPSAPAS